MFDIEVVINKKEMDLFYAKIANRLDDVGQLIEDRAKEIVPVITGNLQKSIYHTTDKQNLILEIGAKAPYAADIEFGTSKREPKPYLRPALYENLAEIEDIMNK